MPGTSTCSVNTSSYCWVSWCSENLRQQQRDQKTWVQSDSGHQFGPVTRGLCSSVSVKQGTWYLSLLVPVKVKGQFKWRGGCHLRRLKSSSWQQILLLKGIKLTKSKQTSFFYKLEIYLQTDTHLNSGSDVFSSSSNPFILIKWDYNHDDIYWMLYILISSVLPTTRQNHDREYYDPCYTVY